jgi:hypothetical protein
MSKISRWWLRLASGAILAVAVMPLANAETVTVAAAGDISRVNIGTPQVKTAEQVSAMAPQKVLVLGDAQYEQGEYANFIQSYDPTWGAFNSIAAPLPGDAEYKTPGAAGYFQYFANVLSPYGAAASDPTKSYYSFNVGDWHVVAVNSICSAASGVSCREQRNFLRNDLEADTHLCEIVFYHHPNKEAFAETSAANGVELLMTGHKHVYERWDQKFGLDIRQLVVGTGGKSLGTPAANADAGVKAFGVAKLVLSETSYSWEFIDRAGTVRDSGSDTCA